MALLGFLPAITLLLIYVVFTSHEMSLRRAYLYSLLVWGVGIIGVTEGLSLLHALSQGAVFTAWGIAFGGLMVASVRDKDNLRDTFLRILRAPFGQFPVVIGGVALIAVVILINGLIAAPNYWDAITYHMPRVMHWAQNGSVDHYFSNNTRQLAMPPFTEYIILHLQLLTGGDRFAAFPQWMSMVSSLVVVDLIAERLGANVKGRVFAVVFAVTLPVGILEASSVQTDYMVAMWLLVFVYSMLVCLEKPSHLNLIALGAALGLALLSKATAYLYALPLVLWFAIAIFKRMPRDVPRVALLVGVTILILNLGHYTRNWIQFSSPIGSTQEFEQSVNGRFGLDVTLSNTIRNASLHLGLDPLTSDRLTHAIGNLHKALGLDVNDQDTTWGGLKFTVWPLSPLENKAGNPVHFVAGVISVALILALSSPRANRTLVLYALTLILGLVIFSAYLRWTQVHQRLHLPLFLLLAPLPGVLVGRSLRPLSVQILSFGLLILALPYTFSNGLRPLIATQYAELPSVITTPRTEQYFYELPEVEAQFRGAAEAIAETSCKEIGLISGNESFEYWLWVLLQEKGKRYRIYHVDRTIDRLDGRAASTSAIAEDSVCLHVYIRYVDAYRLRGGWEMGGDMLYESEYVSVARPDLTLDRLSAPGLPVSDKAE